MPVSDVAVDALVGISADERVHAVVDQLVLVHVSRVVPGAKHWCVIIVVCDEHIHCGTSHLHVEMHKRS